MTASVTVSLKVPDGVEVYSDADLTQVVDSLPFGAVEVDVFGTVTESPRKPVWVKNHSNSVIRLRLEDDLTFGQVLFGFGGGEPRPSPDHAIVLEPEQVVAGEVGLRFFEGVTGDHQFTVSFIAEGPIVAPTATPRPAPTPIPSIKRGGILKNMMVPRDPASMDPHAQSGSFELWPIAGIYDTLLRWDPEQGGGPGRRIIGDLAESWDVSPDGLIYTFHLYKDVVWQDGTPFSSDDVLASLEHMLGILDPEFNSPRGGALLKPLVESVSAPDDDTIVVKLQFPTLLILPSLASDWVKILKREINETKDPVLTDPKNIIGTGPFRFKALNRGLGFEWEKSTSYRLAPEFPYVDGVESIISVDKALVIATMITKQVYMNAPQPFLSPENIETLKDAIGEENLAPIQFAVAAPGMAHVNTRKAPFKDNPNAVRAVWLALDRWQIQKDGMEFDAAPGEVPGAPIPRAWIADFALPEEELLAHPGIQQLDGQKHPDDLAEANRLWAKAVPEGLSTECMGSPQSHVGPVIQVVASQLERFLGIKCTVALLTPGEYLTRGNAGDFVVSYIVMGTTLPDASEYLGFIWSADGARNWGAYFDPEFEDLFQQQIEETNVAKRKAIIQTMQRIVIDYTRAVPSPNMAVAQMVWNYLSWSCVKNWHSGPSIFDDRRQDRIWLDDGCR